MVKNATGADPSGTTPVSADLTGVRLSRVALAGTSPDNFITDVPARLDRLPWDRFHWLVCVALGVTWILDGLEVTLVGSLGGAIQQSPTLRMTETEFGLTGSAYLVGAVLGALLFGWLADRLGRKRLFSVTVLVYMVATVATGFAWDVWSFALFRFLTGAGIGGEYAAINSAIQELIPARRRGTTDLAINGTFWAGAAIGSVVALVVLHPAVVDPEIGWRAGFVVGGALSLVVLVLRRWVPESPRWLMTHGRPDEAARIVAEIEAGVARRHGPLPPRGVRLHRAAPPRARHHRRGSASHVPRPPAPLHARPDADGLPGLLLQRRVLHLRPGANEVLRDPGPGHRLVRATLRAGQPAGPAAARAAVRQHRAQANDHHHLRASPAC